jgi:hypothetical protein
MRHRAHDLGLALSSPLQPGQAFLSLLNAPHRRQFMPQGAMSIVGIVFGFINLLRVMFVLPIKLVLVYQRSGADTWP